MSQVIEVSAVATSFVGSQDPLHSWGFVQTVLLFAFWATVPVFRAIHFSIGVCAFTGKPVGRLHEASKCLFTHRSARFLAASVARWVIASNCILWESAPALRGLLVGFSGVALNGTLCRAFLE